HTGSFTSSSLTAMGGRAPLGIGRRSSGMTTMSTSTTTTSSRTTRTTLPFRLDRDGPKEFLVLRGQLGGKALALGACEEDSGVRAALEDLLHGIARGVGRRQRCLDRLHEALEETFEVSLSRHATLR